MLDVQNLAAKYVTIQHEAVLRADDAALRRHISDTLRRCLPSQVVTDDMSDSCFRMLCSQSNIADPMHTGAIHAYAGRCLLEASTSTDPLLQRLHESAQRLLPKERPACRDDLHLVVLDALHEPGLLPPGMHLAFLRHRLGLNGHPPLSCEEIAIRMHQPITHIHEIEAAILTILSAHHNGGRHA